MPPSSTVTGPPSSVRPVVFANSTQRIGFSARGSFKRSDFGVTYGIPNPGTTFGIGDDVQVVLETEFTGPAFKASTP